MKSVLVTGFSNFGNVTNNPSEKLVKLLAKQVNSINTYIFKGYKDIDENLQVVLNEFRPEIVIMFGLASRTPFVRLERFAVHKDNLEGEIQYESTLPLNRIYQHLISQRIETQYSDNSGSYWCNYLFYKAGSFLSNSDTIYGFIHIPEPEKYKKTYGRNLDLFNLGITILDSVEN